MRATSHPARALGEGSLLAAVLLLATAVVAPVEPVNALWASLGIGGAYAGIVAGGIVAGRARAATGSLRRRLADELGVVGAGVVAGFVVAFVAIAIAGWLRSGLLASTTARVGDPERATIALAVGTGIPLVVGFVAAFVVARLLVVAWPAWDRLRATRLLWALTHTQLVGALALAGLVAIVTLVAIALANRPVFVDLGGDPAAQDVLASPIARLLLIALPIALTVAFAGLVAAAVLVPLVALASYRLLRRTTRRLERLTEATGALRLGALDTRVELSGADEIGRLQADFNAMATDLQGAVSDLETERDTVARLLAERRELVANVSHELRTPVATVRAHLEFALEHWGEAPPPTLRADLAVMDAEAARLQRLIEDLFDLARVEVDRLPFSIVPTSVGPLLARSVDGLRPYAARERRVEIALDVPPYLPLALIDPERLDQVVRNLLVNAIRHSPPGGVVLVTAIGTPHDIVIEVEDTGPGIEPDALPRIWDRFFRGRGSSDRDPRGAGLGLALVKEFTEAMGGKVLVTSELGQGSSFVVHLPPA